MITIELRELHSPEFVTQLNKLVDAMAANRALSVRFALEVFTQHADARHFPLDAFDVARFGAVQ